MKLIQIGPVSYVGGVSIHINRLIYILSEDIDYSISIIDESPLNLNKKKFINLRKWSNFFDYYKCLKYADVIHIHSVHWLIRIYNIFWALILKRKIIVTLHSFRLNKLKLDITSFFLKRVELIISVNDEIYQKINKLNKNSIIKEAFIPPNIETELMLPQQVIERLDNEKKIKTLICANAFRLTPFNNAELYGFDQCVEIAKMAKKEGLNILVIYVIGTLNKNDNIYNYYSKIITNEQLMDYIWTITEQISFVRLITECNLVLRPTLSDGDALTVREAIFLDKNVIASDVVKRPSGTTLYKTGDVLDLFNKIKDEIKIKSFINKKNDLNINDLYKFYNNIYNSCYNSHKN
jgi:glycosyltransferase involved in cell wall biosynthesis